MSQILVDLSLARSYSSNTIEHEGTASDPYSWSDVKKHVIANSRDGFDDNSSLDAGRPLDSDGFAVEFLCFGTGDVISNTDKINVSDIRFSNPQHTLKFRAADHRTYGLPVVTTKASDPVIGSWLGISNSLNLDFSFTQFILDCNQASAFNLLDFSGLISAKLRCYSNVLLSRNAGLKLARVNNAIGSAAFAKNTVMVRSASTVHHDPLIDFSGTQDSKLLIAANYVARHNTNMNTVTMFRGVAGTQLRTSGNRYAYNSGFNDYAGAASRVTLDSDLNLDYATQGVYNDSTFDGANAYAPKSVSSFWPVHGGLLLQTCTKPSDNLGTCDYDAFGRVSSDILDAGAFTKNYVAPGSEEIHVDLSAATRDTTKLGSDASPLSLADFLEDYSRRAPVVNSISYILRNENATAVPSFNLGPLSPNTSAPNRKYGGAGSILVTSYKAYSMKQALLRVTEIKPNNDLTVTFDNLRLLWDEGADWIKSGEVSNPGGKLNLDRCVIRSTDQCTQSLIDLANESLSVRLSGSTVMLGNTQANLDAAGIFVVGENSKLDCVLNILATSSQNIGQAQGIANFKGNYVNGVVSGTFTGASTGNNRFNTANLDTVFVDHDNADFRNQDFHLVGSSGNAHAIVDNVLPLSEWTEVLEYDARGLIRDATPNGSASYDAGAYEYDYFAPPSRLLYVDLSKTDSGHSGKQIDKFSVIDLLNEIQKYQTTPLDHRLEFSVSGYASKYSLVLSGIESTDTGKIVFTSDNPNAPATYNASSPLFSFEDFVNTRVLIDASILRSEVTEPLIELKTTLGTFDSLVDVNRSILWKSHRAYLEFTTNSFITNAACICGSYTVVNGTHWIPGADVQLTMQNIAQGFRDLAGFNADYECYVDGKRLVFVAVVAATCDLATDATGVTVHDVDTESQHANIGVGWRLNTYGSTVCEKFAPGVSRTSIGIKHDVGSFGRHDLVAFQGEVGKSAACVSGNANVTLSDSRYFGFTAPTGGVVTTDVLGSIALYGPAYKNDTVLPVNFDLQAGYDVLTASTAALANYDFDYETDITGSLRSELYASGSDTFDVGAVEKYKLATNQSFDLESYPAIVGLTPAGLSLNMRHDIDGLGFKVVGYTLHNEGYIYWKPTRTAPLENQGQQAKANVVLVNNTFIAGNSVSVTFGVTTVTATYNVVNGFVAGTTKRRTAENILASLNKNSAFRARFYGEINDEGLSIYAKQFGVVGNAYVLATSGTAFSSTTFSGGLDPLFSNKVWPVTSSHSPFERIETPDASSQSYVIRLDTNQANAPIGELAMIAQITTSPIPEEVGTYVVYAVARFGLHVKHNREVLVKRFIFQF